MHYLDHAATSWPKPPEVGQRIAWALDELPASAGRSGHRPALDAARLVFDVRSRLAQWFDVRDPADVIFTRGCTESINLVLRGLLRRGDRVVVSPLEHNAVMRPLARLVRERAIVVVPLAADRWGRVEPAAAARAVREHRPALAVVQHASNVHGAVQDISSLRESLGQTPLLVDAAQTAGVLPLRATADGIDFLACSVHKGLLGPTGLGVCCLSPRWTVEPLIDGGTGSRSESHQSPPFRPDCYEAGTLNLHGIAGLLGALEGLSQRGLLGEHKRALSSQLIEGLSRSPRVKIQSPVDGTALCVSFTVEGAAPSAVASRLEREARVLGRPGLHCAPSAHQHLGTFPAGSMRLSPGWGTAAEAIAAALDAVREMEEERSA